MSEQLSNLPSTEERLAKIEAEFAEFKRSFEGVKRNTDDIVNWIKSGQIIIAGVEKAGNGLYWLAKVIVAFSAIYGVVSAFRSGGVLSSLKIPFL